MLGVDAADAAVVEQLIAEGRLPALARLRDEGLYTRLDSPADRYTGGVWPTFYTGCNVPAHGIFHNKLWRPEAMRVEVPDDSWIGARPFWESRQAQDLEACLIDVPMVLGRPRPMKGVYLGGWGTHDVISKGSWPPSLWGDLQRRFGPPLMPAEHFGRQSPRSLRILGDALVRTTEQLRDIAIHLLTSRSWQLGCVVFGTAHRAGHYLWDRSQVEADRPGDAPGTPHAALTRIYASVDGAIGALLEHVPSDTLVIAFAAHGMGPNTGWSDVFPEILARLETARTGRSERRGLLYALKQRVPFELVRPALERLPAAVNHRLVPFWSRRMFDWGRTRYFPVPMDEAGYLRINLRGREPEGIVEAGAEYDALCAEIEQLLGSLRDEATGAPIVTDIARAYRDAPAAAPYRRLLPDLIVRFGGPRARAVRRLVSPALPAFGYDVPSGLPSGRSGNHTNKAWLVACGPGIERGTLAGRHAVRDLAPTVLEQLGVEPPAGIEGRPFELTAGR